MTGGTSNIIRSARVTHTSLSACKTSIRKRFGVRFAVGCQEHFLIAKSPANSTIMDSVRAVGFLCLSQHVKAVWRCRLSLQVKIKFRVHTLFIFLNRFIFYFSWASSGRCVLRRILSSLNSGVLHEGSWPHCLLRLTCLLDMSGCFVGLWVHVLRHGLSPSRLRNRESMLRRTCLSNFCGDFRRLPQEQ